MPRSLLAAAVATALALTTVPVFGAEPSLDRIVSANPENWTPNVNDGKVEGMVQVGNRIIAVGKFTNVTAGGDDLSPQQHLRVQCDHRSDGHQLRARCRDQGGQRHRRRR